MCWESLCLCCCVTSKNYCCFSRWKKVYWRSCRGGVHFPKIMGSMKSKNTRKQKNNKAEGRQRDSGRKRGQNGSKTRNGYNNNKKLSPVIQQTTTPIAISYPLFFVCWSLPPPQWLSTITPVSFLLLRTNVFVYECPRNGEQGAPRGHFSFDFTSNLTTVWAIGHGGIFLYLLLLITYLNVSGTEQPIKIWQN